MVRVTVCLTVTCFASPNFPKYNLFQRYYYQHCDPVNHSAGCLLRKDTPSFC